MTIKYDTEANAKYISLQKNKKGIVARTQELEPWLMADYDAHDNLVGVEILNASQNNGSISIYGNKVQYLPHLKVEKKSEVEVRVKALDELYLAKGPDNAIFA